MKALLLKPALVAKVKSGAKTQTRRLLPCKVKVGDILFVPEATWVYGEWAVFGTTKTGNPKYRFLSEPTVRVICPENFDPNVRRIAIRKLGNNGYTLRSPLHCRAKDARLFLKVTARRDEPLQEIINVDAVAEGIERRSYWTAEGGWRDYRMTPGDCGWFNGPGEPFRALWDSINGQAPAKCWAANPTVAVITFEVTENPFAK